jgi:hypothetical protein
MGTHITQNQTLAFSIYRYEINATNGTLTQPVNEATAFLPAQDTKDCYLTIAAMNGKGTMLYDNEFCGTHEGDEGFFHERTVDPQTGALGAPEQIFTWGIDTDAYPDSVQIVKGLLFAFAYPIANEPFDELRVYQVTTNRNAKPLIDCKWTTSATCGADIGIVHPSAKYVFYTNAQDNTTGVDAVDMTSKQLVPTGTMFTTPTPNVLKFSPDGSIVYSLDQANSTVSIFGFDASTTAIATGGSVTAPNAILPAERR